MELKLISVNKKLKEIINESKQAKKVKIGHNFDRQSSQNIY